MPHHEQLSVEDDEAGRVLIRDIYGELVAVLDKHRRTKPLSGRSAGAHHDIQIRRAYVMAASGPMLLKLEEIRRWLGTLNEPLYAGMLRRIDELIATAVAWPPELPAGKRPPLNFDDAPFAARTEAAIEAAAKALHEAAREKRQFTWEKSSEEWRVDLRNFVRPIVEAALEASDAFLATAIPKPKTEEPPR